MHAVRQRAEYAPHSHASAKAYCCVGYAWLAGATVGKSVAAWRRLFSSWQGSVDTRQLQAYLRERAASSKVGPLVPHESLILNYDEVAGALRSSGQLKWLRTRQEFGVSPPGPLTRL